MASKLEAVQPSPALMSPADEAVPSRAVVIWRSFAANKMAIAALIVFGIIVLACLLAPLLTPYDPNTGAVQDRLLPIGSPGHPLGTDEQGRDLLTRILYGGRLSLLSGILPVAAAVLIGGGLGIIAGYAGGIVNTIIMRTMDIVISFPAILLAIGISASLGPGIGNVIISGIVIFIPPIARIAETAVKEVKKEEYIEAARTTGASSWLVVRHYIMVNIFSKVFVYSTSMLAPSLLLASGLSFLGLGVSPPTAEWGFMLNNLKQLIFIDPLVTVVPGLFILLTSLAMNVISEALSDAMELKR